MIETLERLGFPLPTGWGRNGDWCSVTWGDTGNGHYDTRTTDDTSWGFAEPPPKA